MASNPTTQIPGHKASEEQLRNMSELMGLIQAAQHSADVGAELLRTLKLLENELGRVLSDPQWREVFTAILQADVRCKDWKKSIERELSAAACRRHHRRTEDEILALVDFASELADAAWSERSFKMSAYLFCQAIGGVTSALANLEYRWDWIPEDIRLELAGMVSTRRFEIRRLVDLKRREVPDKRLWNSLPEELKKTLAGSIAAQYPRVKRFKDPDLIAKRPGVLLALRDLETEDHREEMVRREKGYWVVIDPTERRLIRAIGSQLGEALLSWHFYQTHPQLVQPTGILSEGSCLDWCLRTLHDQSQAQLIRRLCDNISRDTPPKPEDLMQLDALRGRVDTMFDPKWDGTASRALSTLSALLEKEKKKEPAKRKKSKPESDDASEADSASTGFAGGGISCGMSFGLSLRIEVKQVQRLLLQEPSVLEPVPALERPRYSRAANLREESREKLRARREKKFLRDGAFSSRKAKPFLEIAESLAQRHGLSDLEAFKRIGAPVLANLANYEAHAAEDELLEHANEALGLLAVRSRNGQVSTIDADTDILARFKDGQWQINDGALFNPSTVRLSSLFADDERERALALAELRVRSYALKRFLLQQIGDSYPGAVYVEYANADGPPVRIMYAPTRIGARNVMFSFHLHPASYSLNNFERADGMNWLPNVRSAAPQIAQWFDFYHGSASGDPIRPDGPLREWERKQRKIRSSRRD